MNRRALVVALCLACEPADSGGSSSTDTGSTTTVQEAPCQVEGERRCQREGLSVDVCESAQWESRTCRSECAKVDGCSLGCIITAEGEDCLCFPSEVPCS